MPEIVIRQQQRENECRLVVLFCFFLAQEMKEKRGREKRQCVSSIMASDLMAVVAIAKKAEEANRGKEEEETRLAVVVCVFLTVILRDSDNNDHAKLQHYFHQLSLSLMSSPLDAISKQNKKGSNRPKEHRQRERERERMKNNCVCACVVLCISQNVLSTLCKG